LVLVPEPHASPEQFGGWLSGEQRADTAPLIRDNSRVNQPASDYATAASQYHPEDHRRPGYEQPYPNTAATGYGTTAYGGYYSPQPSGYSTAQRPMPPPPGPDSGRKRITLMGWVGRGLILVAISVVSGLIWYAIKPHHPQQIAGSDQQVTKYPFTPVARQVSAGDCKSVSTYSVASFFAQHECSQLVRELYTTTLPGGQKVLTSVIVVRMPNVESATKLRSIAAASNTGDVQALKETASSGQQPFPTLQDDAYETAQKGNVIVIGDSAYFVRATPEKDPQLLAVSTDALKLGLQ
jgi:hypothetical protein